MLITQIGTVEIQRACVSKRTFTKAVISCSGKNGIQSTYNKKVYCSDLVTIGDHSTVPAGMKVGRNTAILGETTAEDYEKGCLAAGGAIVKAGEGL